jgi:hypothetical protein
VFDVAVPGSCPEARAVAEENPLVTAGARRKCASPWVFRRVGFLGGSVRKPGRAWALASAASRRLLDAVAVGLLCDLAGFDELGQVRKDSSGIEIQAL